MNEDELKELQERYKRGGEGHGHFKMTLKEKIWDYYKEAREKREYYQNHRDEVYEILDLGAKKAGEIASKKMQKIRDAVGIYR
jgi:tryptophanyl-tRNA synthetase